MLSNCSFIQSLVCTRPRAGHWSLPIAWKTLSLLPLTCRPGAGGPKKKVQTLPLTGPEELWGHTQQGCGLREIIESFARPSLYHFYIVKPFLWLQNGHWLENKQDWKPESRYWGGVARRRQWEGLGRHLGGRLERMWWITRHWFGMVVTQWVCWCPGSSMSLRNTSQEFWKNTAFPHLHSMTEELHT